MAEKFLDVSPERIVDLVQGECEALAEVPVREYIPILVEHEDGEDLTRKSRDTGDGPM